MMADVGQSELGRLRRIARTLLAAVFLIAFSLPLVVEPHFYRAHPPGVNVAASQADCDMTTAGDRLAPGIQAQANSGSKYAPVAELACVIAAGCWSGVEGACIPASPPHPAFVAASSDSRAAASAGWDAGPDLPPPRRT
jgi:hypothetical protein